MVVGFIHGNVGVAVDEIGRNFARKRFAIAIEINFKVIFFNYQVIEDNDYDFEMKRRCF